jgi:hypothetical protein
MKKYFLFLILFSSCGQEQQEDPCDKYINMFYIQGREACIGVTNNKCCDCARVGMLLTPDGCDYPDYDKNEKEKEIDCNWIRGMCIYGIDSPVCISNLIDTWKFICRI